MSLKKTGEFVASDHEGNKQKLLIYEIDPGQGPTCGARPEAQPIIKTVNGVFVHRLSKGKYQVEIIGTQLTSDDPQAP